MTNVVHSLDYLLARALQAPRLTSIVIYSGYIDDAKTNRPRLQIITPVPGDGIRNFGTAFDYFRNNTFGTFTAVFKPNQELVYFENRREGESQIEIEPGARGTLDLQQLVDRLTEREIVISELKKEIQSLREELEENNTIERKFGFGLEKVLLHFFPGSAAIINPTINPPMQGTSNWQTTKIETPEDALTVIVDAMSIDWLVQFAIKLQQNPTLVNTIKSYL